LTNFSKLHVWNSLLIFEGKVIFNFKIKKNNWTKLIFFEILKGILKKKEKSEPFSQKISKKNRQNLLFCTSPSKTTDEKQNVYKIARLLKQEKLNEQKWKQQKIFSAPNFFSCFKSCVCHYIFLWHYFPPPSFHKFLCVLDIKKNNKKEKNLFFFQQLILKKR